MYTYIIYPNPNANPNPNPNPNSNPNQVAADPDADDFVYSAGDTVTLTFDAPTDRGGAEAFGGNKAYVDRLVSFSDVLA